MSDQEKEQIKALPVDDLVLLHFSLGKHIRNVVGLNDGNKTLLGDRTAHDAAMKIIDELWKRFGRTFHYGFRKPFRYELRAYIVKS